MMAFLPEGNFQKSFVKTKFSQNLESFWLIQNFVPLWCARSQTRPVHRGEEGGHRALLHTNRPQEQEACQSRQDGAPQEFSHCFHISLNTPDCVHASVPTFTFASHRRQWFQVIRIASCASVCVHQCIASQNYATMPSPILPDGGPGTSSAENPCCPHQQELYCIYSSITV